jgi:hypothetical protein
MTEQELIDLGFKKIIVKNEESGNGYDYYYYVVDIMEGLSLTSIADDEVEDNTWYVMNHEWPNAKIKDVGSIKNLADLAKTWKS